MPNRSWAPTPLPIDEARFLKEWSQVQPAGWRCNGCGQRVDGTLTDCPDCSRSMKAAA